MHIGLAFDLKADRPAAPDLPDDWQEEFDSPVTVTAIADALTARGHRVTELGDGRELVEKLLAAPPDLVFNIAEGHGVGRSREARVPAVCEMLGVPYTGSDPGTLAVALDKAWARTLALSVGWVPWGQVYHGPDDPYYPLHDYDTVRWPVIAKPVWEGSSKGIRRHCLIERPGPDDPVDPKTILDALWRDYRQPILVEEFIAGDEITVGVLGPTHAPQVLGIMRIIPRTPSNRFVYSLEVKRDFRRLVEYECPARLPAEVLAEIERLAGRIYQGLGCRDVARIDFRLRDDRVPYFIEANPLPGLNPESSDLVILAERVGVSHDQLIGRILDAALDRLR